MKLIYLPWKVQVYTSAYICNTTHYYCTQSDNFIIVVYRIRKTVSVGIRRKEVIMMQQESLEVPGNCSPNWLNMWYSAFHTQIQLFWPVIVIECYQTQRLFSGICRWRKNNRVKLLWFILLAAQWLRSLHMIMSLKLLSLKITVFVWCLSTMKRSDQYLLSIKFLVKELSHVF